MANEKISQLPAAGSTSGGDLYPIVQSGANFSVTFTVLQAAIASALVPAQLPLITLTGDVTGTGSAGTVVTSIASATVTAKLLTGYSVGANTAILASDTILQAFGKIQAQINNTDVTAITQLIGDVSAIGPGSVAATVNSVGGKSASAIATSVTLTAAATSANTPSTLVERDGSGNFSAGIVTASLVGNVTGNVSGTASNITGTSNSTITTLSALILPGSQVTGNISGTASNITATSNSTLVTLTSLILAGSQVSGDISGNAAGFTGSLSGDVTGTQSTTNIASSTVTGKLLTGLIAGPNTTILATDTILAALAKLQAQVSSESGLAITSLTGDVTATGPGAAASTISVGAVTDTKASLSNKPAVAVVSTINLTLSGLQTIDGITTAVNTLVLATAQSTASQNGPWQAQTGAWTRPTWYPSGGTTQAFQFITTLARLGTTYQGSTWRQTAAGPITIDTTATTWVVTPLAINSSTLSGILPIANGGTNNNVAYTAGSVIFSNGSALTQNNANFFWDNVNLALGIGVSPGITAVLDIVNSSGSNKAVQTTGYGSNVGFRGRYANGTSGSPTASVLGNTLNYLSGRGYGTTAFASASTGVIGIFAGGTFTDSSMPTYMTFSVTPVGAVATTEAMRIAPTGDVLIGTTADNGVDKLQISGGLSAAYLKLLGATSGYVEQMVPSTVTSYNVSWPNAQGASSSYLLNDGAGNLSWTTGTPPAVSSNIDGGTSATLYTSPQIVIGGTA